MDRLIEFRGLDKKTNKWVYGDLIHTPEKTKRIIWLELKGEMPLDVDYNSFNELVESESVGQFTGLIDSKGVKIYEGDIVQHLQKKEVNGVVSFFEGSFIVGTAITSNSLINFNVPKYFEVIGNIHEK